MMRSGNFNSSYFYNTMKTIDDYVTDNSPIVDKYLIKYDEKFIRATNPPIFFRLYKFPFSSYHHFEKIIVVAIFVNFLRIFKVYNFAHFHVHDQGIAENGTGIAMFPF